LSRVWEIIVLERYKRCSTTSASILLTQRFSHRGIIMPELQDFISSSADILANGAVLATRLEACDYSRLLYSVNYICVGCKRHVWAVRQEEIFISDGQGLRRPGNHR